jgi:hypothetical protein
VRVVIPTDSFFCCRFTGPGNGDKLRSLGSKSQTLALGFVSEKHGSSARQIVNLGTSLNISVTHLLHRAYVMYLIEGFLRG